MSPQNGNAAELRVKNLEMIQSVITRIASNGAATKNYCVTVTTAVCGFGIALERPLLALLALLPLSGFALLDAQYLRVERRFRALFDRVRNENWSKAPDFEITTKNAPPSSFSGAFFSWSILSFYLPVGGAIAFIVIIARFAYGV